MKISERIRDGASTIKDIETELELVWCIVRSLPDELIFEEKDRRQNWEGAHKLRSKRIEEELLFKRLKDVF